MEEETIRSLPSADTMIAIAAGGWRKMRAKRYLILNGQHPVWELLHPSMTMDGLGFIPDFLRTDDPRPAAEQFNERYVFGGGRAFGKGKYKLDDDNTLHYPEDPPFEPLAQCMLRDELIVFYPGEFVAIIQPDRSFDVSRMD